MSTVFKRYLVDFAQLLFPRNCMGCEQSLLHHEAQLCIHCLTALPYTNFFEQKENKAYEILRAQHEIDFAVSMFYFRKKGIVQHLLHQLKYQNHPEVGILLGEMLALRLIKFGWHEKLNAIMGVPMTTEKIKKRGYNQCDLLIQGVLKHLKLRDLSPYIQKLKTTESQTKKHRFERYQGLDHVYEITSISELEGTHVLLIDDIITTGATFTHMIDALNAHSQGIEISVASIAITTH